MKALIEHYRCVVIGPEIKKKNRFFLKLLQTYGHKCNNKMIAKKIKNYHINKRKTCVQVSGDQKKTRGKRKALSMAL